MIADGRGQIADDQAAGNGIQAGQRRREATVDENQPVGTGIRQEVSSMPGVFQMSIDVALPWLQQRAEDGFGAYLIFGVIDVVWICYAELMMIGMYVGAILLAWPLVQMPMKAMMTGNSPRQVAGVSFAVTALGLFLLSFVTGMGFLGPESGRISKGMTERGPEDADVQRRIDLADLSKTISEFFKANGGRAENRLVVYIATHGYADKDAGDVAPRQGSRRVGSPGPRPDGRLRRLAGANGREHVPAGRLASCARFSSQHGRRVG